MYIAQTFEYDVLCATCKDDNAGAVGRARPRWRSHRCRYRIQLRIRYLCRIPFRVLQLSVESGRDDTVLQLILPSPSHQTSWYVVIAE